MSDRYFVFFDQAHGKSVVTGDNKDSRLFHEDPGTPQPESPVTSPPRDNAQWRFQHIDGDYYYIVDRLHASAIGGGDNYDGQIYHFADYTSRTNCQWRVVQTGTPGVFTLIDRKHRKALVTGDVQDGNLYHQDPGDRRNARWAVELASDGDIGPKFYIAKQEMLAFELDSGLATRVAEAPILVIDNTPVSSDGAGQSVVLTKEYTEKVTETITMQHAVTVGLMVSITSAVGIEGVWAGWRRRTSSGSSTAMPIPRVAHTRGPMSSPGRFR